MSASRQSGLSIAITAPCAARCDGRSRPFTGAANWSCARPARPLGFPGEAQILAHYVSLDNLARVLFHKDGSVNAMVQGQFRALHHLGEGISFYLQDLLAAVQPDQILGVLLQEQLEADLLRLFGLCSPGRLNDNSQPDLHPAHSEDRRLSLQAQNNLRRFLHTDYACIKTLDAWGKLPAGYLQGLDEALPSPPQDGADGWRAWAKPRGHALFP